MTGNLPSHLRVIATKPRKVQIDWDDGSKESSSLARAAYISDESNETTIERGHEWAKGYRHGGVSKEFTIPNTSAFTADTRIVGLEHRSEGGRAWKVVITWEGESYLVDLREDTLLDLLLGPGVDKNGYIKAPLVWGKVGSQMKLVLVGSDLHAALLEANEVDKTKPPKSTDLKVGDVWGSKNGDRAVFLGWVSTIQMDCKRGRWNEEDTVTLKRLPRVQAWFDLSDYEPSLQKALDDWHWFRFKVKQSSSYRIPSGKVKVPADWVARLETATREDWAKKCAEHYNRNYLSTPSNMACFCMMMHLGAPGEMVPLKTEWKPWAHLLSQP